MQTLRLKRLLVTHYSLLVPFPPPPPSPRPPPPSFASEHALTPPPLARTTTFGRPGSGTWRRLYGRGGAAIEGREREQGHSGEGGTGGARLGALDTIEELSDQAAAEADEDDEEEKDGGGARWGGGGGPVRLVGFSDPDPLNPQ
ncbi:hypothetical protein JCM8208_005019, partial [Rhodotorula glutinis]